MAKVYSIAIRRGKRRYSLHLISTSQKRVFLKLGEELIKLMCKLRFLLENMVN